MSFTSIDFLAFFGILIILYYALPKKIQWIVLLVASYTFYTLAGLKYIGFILFFFAVRRFLSVSKNFFVTLDCFIVSATGVSVYTLG